jgi:asparagine synthetase B (glutamine-hydrolysing)
LQDGLDAISDVIYHTETYDVTTIRASTPMFLMTRKIKALGVKMVLSGEGSDEIFGGYLYFHKAPSKEELHKETLRKVGRQIPGPSILKAFSKFSADSLHAVCSTSGLQAGVSVLNVNLCFVFGSFQLRLRIVKHAKSTHAKMMDVYKQQNQKTFCIIGM